VAIAATRQVMGHRKESFMRHAHWMFIVGLVSIAGLSSCNEEQVAKNDTSNASHTLTVPSGTPIEVTLGTALTSETAASGTAWSGTVLSGREGIPSGSAVQGIVTAVNPAKKGDRAMLDLGMTSITVAGHSYAVLGSTESVIAGSTRARNLGAIAGSAAAGALVGHAVTGTSQGAVVGAVVGGGAATGVVAASDGYQVVLKPGIAITFTTTESVDLRP
jgi:hypothetical protein